MRIEGSHGSVYGLRDDLIASRGEKVSSDMLGDIHSKNERVGYWVDGY